jgi:hypothetical protein
MDGKSKVRGFEFRESKEFTKELAKIARIKHVDEALSILQNAIMANPQKFKIVPGTKKLRVAKTESYTRNNVAVPSLRIYFSIEVTDDCDYVDLLYIETADL